MSQKILIVDRDPVNAERLLRPLAEAGYHVTAPADPEMAVEFFQRTSPHLVLIDARLPDQRGVAICRELRELDPAGDARFVLLTGPENADIDLPATDRSVCDRVVDTPVTDDDLVALCRAILNETTVDAPAEPETESAPSGEVTDTDMLHDALEELDRIEFDEGSSDPAEAPLDNPVPGPVDPTPLGGARDEDLSAHIDQLLGGDPDRRPSPGRVASSAKPRRSSVASGPDDPGLESAIDELLTFDHEASVTQSTTPSSRPAPSPIAAAPRPSAAPAARPAFQTQTVARPAKKGAPAVATTASSGRRGMPLIWLAAAAMGLTLLVAGGWFFFAPGGPATPRPEAAAPLSTSTDPGDDVADAALAAPVLADVEPVSATEEPAQDETESADTETPAVAPETPKPKPIAPITEPTPEPEPEPEPAIVATPPKPEPAPAAAPRPDETTRVEDRPVAETAPVEPAATVDEPAASPDDDEVPAAPARSEPEPEATDTAAAAAAAPEPVTMKPILVDRVQPDFPAKEIRRHSGEQIALSVLVNEQGDVTRVVVEETVDDSVLEQIAIDAVRRWRYQPGTEDGQAVKAWATVRFAFQ